MAFREGAEGESDDKPTPENTSEADETKVRLDVADDDDGDDDDKTPDDKPQADGQPRKKDGTWAARKAERATDRRAAKAWETEKQDYDRRLRQVQENSDRTVRQLREDMERLSKQTQGQGAPQDRFTAEIVDIRKQLAAELKLIETDDARGYDRYNELQERKNELIADRRIAADREAQKQNQPHRSQYDNRAPFIESEYPWVTEQRYAPMAVKAAAYKNYLVNVEGRPDTLDTDREALAHIQAKFGAEFGMRVPAPPSPRTRSL